MDFSQYRARFDFPHSPIKRWEKYPKDVIPLWVADMDFPAPPAVTEAIVRRASSGRFGYVAPPDDLFDIVVNYCHHRYGWAISGDWIVFLHGVVPGLLASVEATTQPNDSVVVPRPIYAPFFEVVKSSGRIIQDLPFEPDQGRMLPVRKDFDPVSGSKLLMWCNPHNPGGTMFRENELQAIAAQALTNNWLIVSDEIHADMALDSTRMHIPLAKIDNDVADRAITLMSPNKAYNFPSVGMAYAIIPNAKIRAKFKEVIAHWNHFDPLALEAIRAALTKSEDWLSQTMRMIADNVGKVEAWAMHHSEQISMVHPEASYLVWMQVKFAKGQNSQADINLERHFAKYGVGVQDGRLYRASADWFRLNVATDPEVLDEALLRMSKALAAL